MNAREKLLNERAVIVARRWLKRTDPDSPALRYTDAIFEERFKDTFFFALARLRAADEELRQTLLSLWSPRIAWCWLGFVVTVGVASYVMGWWS